MSRQRGRRISNVEAHYTVCIDSRRVFMTPTYSPSHTRYGIFNSKLRRL